MSTTRTKILLLLVLLVSITIPGVFYLRRYQSLVISDLSKKSKHTIQASRSVSPNFYPFMSAETAQPAAH
ncbi:hypothetical protein [uncultured Gimesia sp.]|uniref:hypothetical protein n=1 Tax=uncultured Gimesia sp. TaxID=1678688 RepID=UPI0030DAD508